MSDTFDLQNGCCGHVGKLRPTRIAAWAGILAFLSAMPAIASESQIGESVAPGLGLNQGVTIQDSGVTAEPPTELTPAQSDEVDRAEAAPKPTPQRRMLRRRSRAQARLADPQAVTTPWHQTGLGALSIVLAVVAGLYYLLRRLVPSMRSAENGIVRVVGRTSLTPKHHVALIQLGGKFLAIGMSGDRMAKLCEIDDPVEVAALSARGKTRATRASGSFGDLLFRETAEYRETPNDLDQTPIPAAPRVSTEPRPVRDLLQRLKTLTSR